MLVSTILLIANLIALIYSGTALFSFLHFLWIYPVEIIIYIFLFIVGIGVLKAIGNRK